MPESPLAKKMKLEPGQRAAILNAPPGYLKELSPPPRCRGTGGEIAREIRLGADLRQE